MSGGVDSSVAASLLVEAGYDVVGVFMRLGSPGEDLDVLRTCETTGPSVTASAPKRTNTGVSLRIAHQGCCSINDAADARLVAAHLGIPFYVVNFKKDFGRIIDYFAGEYASGRTPNPCVRCNDWLKFGKLREYAAQIGAAYVASGHYARVEPIDGTPRMLPGLDEDKDQSYVLFGVPREHVGHMLLPVGGMRKSAVREAARTRGLPVFDKPDSQEICFVPDNDYAALVERVRPETRDHEGDVLDESGRVIGRHQGHHRFTLGQRRGVGVATGARTYVVAKDTQANTITLGPAERLLATTCIAGEANWLIDPASIAANADADGWLPCIAKFRYNTPAAPARFRLLPDLHAEVPVTTPSGRAGRFEVRFESPQSAITPGQAIVLYEPVHTAATCARGPVIGGGWIDSVESPI